MTAFLDRRDKAVTTLPPWLGFGHELEGGVLVESALLVVSKPMPSVAPVIRIIFAYPFLKTES